MSENNKKAVMVVKGRSLVDQASKRLTAMEVDHGVLMAGHKLYNTEKPIQVASIDTCLSRDEYPEAELIVIDEAHMAVSDSFKKFLTKYEGKFWLSVTATPWAKEGLEHLASDVVYPISIAELTKQGYLVPAKYFVPNNFDSSNIGIVKGEFSQGASIFEMDRQKITGSIVKNYLKNCVDNRTFLFAINIKHAKDIQDAFKEVGVDSVVITAETKIELRSKEIEKNNLIISVGTLTTGVDVPDLRNIIFARPTASKNLYIQMLGRGTRPFPGKEYFTVYDHVGNVERHGFMENEHKSDLKPTKSKLKRDFDIPVPIKVCHSCLSACHTAVKICPYCCYVFEDNSKVPISGKGELIEYMPESLEERFRKDCLSFIQKAWIFGQKSERVYFQLTEKYGKDVFVKNVKSYRFAKNIYQRWVDQGADDHGRVFSFGRRGY